MMVKEGALTAHRNDPGEYKLLFRYLTLFGLMAYIAGDADHGFSPTIDGPASRSRDSNPIPDTSGLPPA
jgi:uncharacterized protein